MKFDTFSSAKLLDFSEIITRGLESSVYSMYQDPQTAGDKIEMRLMVLDESERSEVMHKLVSAFQQKVLLCFDHYKPDLTLSCLKIVTSLSVLKPKPKTPHHPKPSKGHDNTSPTQLDPFAELDVEEALKRELPIFTVSKLRATVQQLLRRATLRQDGTLYFAGSSEVSMATKSVQYFIWFFDFMDYLQELFVNFEEKIFMPLFKYFHDYDSNVSKGRSNSLSSAFSKLSQFSGSDNQGVFDADQDGDDESDSLAEMRRMRQQAKASLLQLSKEYRDIKSIYDTTETDKVAQRLSFVKEQLDYLLEEEDEIDPDLYSEESRKMVEHLEMDFGTENLIRLVPDILVKLKKAAWLARRWLELDDKRTKDVTVKLEKLAEIEKKLMQRLDVLQQDITRGEMKLERETNELNRLMEKEQRSEVLTFKAFNIDARIEKQQKKLAKLNKERDSFAAQLSDIVKSKDLKEFHKLKFRFESNKLNRFLNERKLATLCYQKNLLADDINIEMFVRPSVIHSSNKLQDDCERLEKQLREQREEMVSIKRALLPVQEDKAMLMNTVSRQKQVQMNTVSRQKQVQPPWNSGGQPGLSQMILQPGHALYIRSVPGGEASQSRPVYGSNPFLRRITVDNNRALRTISPPAW
ncbi:uncharacterized protein LOC131941699 isoform X2 [Physella acuta]|uniref:uncharacterized protein LOC131941699 isoform X2 n=1 Tax=Physella acuta TaxID=109671 RepID=UPI0027DBFB20|nr:uncharacterized protein LOC131941699 isoform X2 [Physella acuta]